MKRKLTIPDALTEQITAQAKKLKTAISRRERYTKEFNEVLADSARFEKEATDLEMATTDYNDDEALNKISMLRRKSQLAKTKAENCGPVEQETIDKLVKEIDASEQPIKACLQVDLEQVVQEITEKLLPYCSSREHARGHARNHTEISAVIGGQIVFAYSYSPTSNADALAARQLNAMESILRGESPVEFVSAAESEAAGK